MIILNKHELLNGSKWDAAEDTTPTNMLSWS